MPSTRTTSPSSKPSRSSSRARPSGNEILTPRAPWPLLLGSSPASAAGPATMASPAPRSCDEACKTSKPSNMEPLWAFAMCESDSPSGGEGRVRGVGAARRALRSATMARRSGAIGLLAEGGEEGELLALEPDRATLAREVIADRLGEAGVAEPMGAKGRLRQIAALDLVRPLGARLDALQAAGDRVIDGAVIAALEVEEGKVAFRAPVAPVERGAAAEVERSGQEPAPALRHDEDDLLGHGGAEAGEEIAREVGMAPFAVAGVAVEAEEGVPVALLDLLPGERQHLEPAGKGGLALLADVLALARAQGGEEIIEVAIAAVVPMELLALALEEAGRAECEPLLLGREGDVERGDAEPPRHLDHAGDERLARAGRGRGVDEQARPGDRREGDRDLQLGVIAPAGALVRLGPAVIEDIFAVGVALEVHGCRGDEPARLVLHDEVAGQPAGLAAGRAALLEGREEGVADARVVGAGDGVPRLGLDLGDALDEPDGRRLAPVRHGGPPSGAASAQATSSTAATSTATFTGSEPEPTAKRACLPASPNTSTKRSEAPFTTLGWSANSGTALTKPCTMATRLTRSRLPSCACAWARMLRAQSRAAARPSSSEISLPTLPKYLSSPFQKVTWPETNRMLPTCTAGT